MPEAYPHLPEWHPTDVPPERIALTAIAYFRGAFQPRANTLRLVPVSPFAPKDALPDPKRTRVWRGNAGT
ncbi:MAG: hypothetical protein ACYC42_04320 [Lysobacter sp.]